MQYFYYPRTTRRVLIAFMDMFNNMKVYNYDTSGNVSNVVNVPLKFGPSEKYHLFNTQTESDKKYYVKLPALLVSIDSISYNSDRATSVNEIRSIYNDGIDPTHAEEFWADVIPTPYDISFKMDIRTESIDHCLQIMENILPYFNPTNHLRIKEFEFLNLERDLRVKLDTTTIEYPTEMGEEESRYFNGSLSFTVDALMYRPIDYAKIIKFVNVNYRYDLVNAETFHTSGVTSGSTPPTDFNYWRYINDVDKIYVKSEDTITVP